MMERHYHSPKHLDIRELVHIYIMPTLLERGFSYLRLVLYWVLLFWFGLNLIFLFRLPGQFLFFMEKHNCWTTF